MKIIRSDFKRGTVTIKVENLDDLWYLSHIVDVHDKVRGQTFRKIKVSSNEERASNVTKIRVTLGIDVLKVEFSTTSNVLRLLGKIIFAPEDISIGGHHTFNVEVNTVITIEKERWLKFQRDKLAEAAREKAQKILICVFDRGEATFALMKKYGFEILSELKGDVQKKSVPQKMKEN